jgi:hypothetical protein
MVAFLLQADKPWDTGGALCFAAERCGDVEASPHNSSLGSEAEVTACFQSRIPPCAAALGALQELEPPSELAEAWPGLVRRRVEMSLELARELEKVWLAQQRKPRLRAPGKQYGSLVDWAYKNEPQFKTYFDARRTEDDRLLEVHRSVDLWTNQHKLCTEGTNCTFEKVMGGAPLARRYWPLAGHK